MKRIHGSISGGGTQAGGNHGVDLYSGNIPGSVFKNSSLKSSVLEFSVELDELHRVWKPSELIKGTLTLKLKKDIPPVRLRLSLRGECQLKSNGAMKAATLRPRHSTDLFEKSRDIYGSEAQPLALTKGEHKFPFSFKIPSNNVYTSIDFEKGCIKYWVQGAIVAAQNTLLVCKQRFQLLVPLDVGNLPKPNIKTVVLQSPGSTTNHMRRFKTAGSTEQDSSASMSTRKTPNSNTNISSGSTGSYCSTVTDNKTVKISVEIPSFGYVIGEEIRVKVQLSHYKLYSHPAGLIATLVRICRVSNQGNLEQTETFRKDICQAVAPVYTNPETYQTEVILKLKVPLDTFPTLSLPNKMFTFQYYVEVLANLSKKNIVYTESNRLVGGTGINDIPIHSGKLNLLPKLLGGLGRYSTQGEDDDEDASIMFFQDLINVDKLKRLRNVAGMSIEAVVGTHKESSISSSQVLEEDLPIDADEFSVVDEVYEALASEHHSGLESYPIPSEPGHSLDYSFQLIYPTDPVPSYTSSTSNPEGHHQFILADDKNELEQVRLRELESEPPM